MASFRRRRVPGHTHALLVLAAMAAVSCASSKSDDAITAVADGSPGHDAGVNDAAGGGTASDAAADGGSGGDAAPDAGGPATTPVTGGWTTIHGGGLAPIRSIVRRSDGALMGPVGTGSGIDVWTSTNEGATWVAHGSVTANQPGEIGDPTMLVIPGTLTVFCAFRQIVNGQWSVIVTRSDDGGDSWVYDSTVVGPVGPFVGAPFLHLRSNGNLQVYYDSEYLASQHGKAGNQWIAMQERNGVTKGTWNDNGVVTAAAITNGCVSREGMATVVDLGGDRIMIVTEGVSCSGAVNEVHAAESMDGGRTWDPALNRTVYQGAVYAPTGGRYNAYVPFGIRVGGGPVGVAFCTDEDWGGVPDASSAPVGARHCHVKYVQTTTTFEDWSGPTDVATNQPNAYTPGLFERASNDVIATIDELNGSILVLHR